MLLDKTIMYELMIDKKHDLRPCVDFQIKVLRNIVKKIYIPKMFIKNISSRGFLVWKVIQNRVFST